MRALALERLIEERIGRSLRTGHVTRVHDSTVNVRVGGSAKILRGLPVIGGTAGIDIGDLVVLREADGRLFAESFRAQPSGRSIVYAGGGVVVGGTGHDPVTIGATLDDVIQLTAQYMTLLNQNANTVFTGPASGSPAKPTFRALGDADIPSAIARDSEVTAAIAAHAAIAAAHHDPVTAGTGIDVTGQQVSHDTGDFGDLHTNYTEHDQAETITATWTWNTDYGILFRDSALKIHSSADGQLDILADVKAYMNTPRVDLAGDLYFTSGSSSIFTTTGDLVLDPAGSNVLPGGSVEDDLGDFNRKWRTLYAAELYVETLVAQDVLSTIGGRILVCPTTQLTSDIAGTQSVLNPGFETAGGGGDDVFADWVEDKQDGTITQDSSTKHGGSFSCKFSFPSGTTTPRITQDMTVTAQERYALAFWTRGDGSTGSGGAYGVYDLSNSAWIISSTGTGIISTDWTKLVDHFTAPVDCVSIRLYLYGPGTTGKDCWFDDANLHEGQIEVEHNNLAQNDYVYLASAPNGVAQIEVMQIESAAGGSGPYTYDVERALDSTGANTWREGDAVANLGSTAGEGYMELTSTQTVHGHEGPNIAIYTRTAAANWDDSKPTVSVGNLESFLDYGSFQVGFAAGNDLTHDPTTGNFRGLALDRSNGLRLWNADIVLYQGANKAVEIQYDGDAFFGSNIASPATTSLVILSNAQSYNSESLGAGDILLGDNSSNQANILWDRSEGRLKFRGGTTTKVWIDTDGSWSMANDNVVIDETGIWITRGDSTPNGINWTGFTAQTSAAGKIYGYESASTARMAVTMYDPGGGEVHSLIRAASGISGIEVEVEAIATSSTAGYIKLSHSARALSLSVGVSYIAPSCTVHLCDNLPVIRLSDADAGTDTAVESYIEWYRGATTNKIGWIGYGNTADTHLTLANALSGIIRFNTGGAERMRVHGSQYQLLIGDTYNGRQTHGLTINQQTATDEILSLKQSNVAHGMTTITETDSYAQIAQVVGGEGGLLLDGLKESGTTAPAIQMRGFDKNTLDTTKSTSARAAVECCGFQGSGTGYTNAGTNANIFAVRTYVGDAITTLAILDAEGDWHIYGSAGSYDEYDDALMAYDLAQVMSGNRQHMPTYSEARLRELGIIGERDQQGRFLVSTKKVNALMLGAHGQAWADRQALRDEVEQLKQQVAWLTDQVASYQQALH